MAALEKMRDMTAAVRRLLSVPTDYQIAILPGSATGSVETALWNLLGPRKVDVLVCDVFSRIWAYDIQKQLQLETRVLLAPFGSLPDATATDPAHDIVFCWTGTTTCVSVPNVDWIADDRLGLTFCDATSAAFLVDLPWQKLDATSFSCQKVLGGEACFGFLVLSPRAVERLVQHTPSWPVPRLMRLKEDGKILEGIFHEKTINTISLLVVEDVLRILLDIESQGGVPKLRRRTRENHRCVDMWIKKQTDFSYFVRDQVARAMTPVGFVPTNKTFSEGSIDEQWKHLTSLADLLEKESFAFDVLGHGLSVPHLRFWIGPTVASEDLVRALNGLSWACNQAREKIG
jgi:phosphoserine aminotransferase